jgi:hypothetical protein
MIVVPAARAVGTVVASVIAVDPTVTADELIVPAITGVPTPDTAYSVFVTPISSRPLPPGGTGTPLFWVTWDVPTHTVFRPRLVTLRVDGPYVDGVKIHVGVTAGFAEDGAPGGKFGTVASYFLVASRVRCS